MTATSSAGDRQRVAFDVSPGSTGCVHSVSPERNANPICIPAFRLPKREFATARMLHTSHASRPAPTGGFSLQGRFRDRSVAIRSAGDRVSSAICRRRLVNRGYFATIQMIRERSKKHGLSF
jgi:hypothetical protein